MAEPGKPISPASEAEATAQADVPEAETAPEDEPSTVERAEHLVDAAGERVGTFAWVVAFNALKYAAIAREEAEDIWAEAQRIRRRGRR